METPMPEWDPYEVRFPKAGERTGNAAVLETAHHVVHVPEARRILENGELRSGLVYDESRLNKSRLSVNWLSANTWAYGSIYGNVQFSFPWSMLIEGRRFYWVEAMKAYRPHAYRILIIDRDLDHSRLLTRYDPHIDKGPLRERDGVWYWNDNYTSEFMVESDLDLVTCMSLDFISHNEKLCRPYGSKCPDRDAMAQRIGARVLSFLLGNNLHSIDHVLKVRSDFHPERQLSDTFDGGVNGILLTLGIKKDRFKGVIRAKASRQAVLRGALALYGADQKSSALNLLALLQTYEVFETALEEIVNDHFGITGWTIER
jgi:hypothetical protein